MKRLVGIVCALFLLFASAAWALEKCQGLVAHHGGHVHGESLAHAHNHSLDLPQEESLPKDPIIHCINSGESPSLIFQPSPKIAPLVITQKILPSFFMPLTAEAAGWMSYSDKRPPGSFLSAISPYLSLSVLRL